MKLLAGRFVDYTHYSAQDFESMPPGQVSMFYGEQDIGGLSLFSNRFVDSGNWSANDFENLPLGTVTDDVSGATLQSLGGSVTINIPSRLVDSANWAANDFETLDPGTLTNVNPSETQSARGTVQLSPSRFV